MPASDRPAVVLIHGYSLTPTVWDGIVPALPTDRAVLTPDLSNVDTVGHMSEYAALLKAQLDAQQVSRAVLIGHSMGGYVALAFAEKYPDVVAGLGLLHSAAHADSPDRQQARLEMIGKLQTEGPTAFAQSFVPNLYAERFRAQSPDTVQRHIDEMARLKPSALVAGLSVMRTRLDRRHVIAGAQYPVLFILGKADKSIPYELAIEQASLSPNASYVLLDDVAHHEVGHMGMVEAPDACLDAIRTLL